MKRLLLILVLFSGMSARAEAPDSLFARANKFYTAGDYAGALQTYDSLKNAGYHSAALYYNLGNTHFRLSNTAEAILYYEKAARLQPDDADIAHNLQIARQQTIDKIETLPDPLFKSALLHTIYWLSPDQWAMSGLILLLLFSIALATYYFSTHKRLGFVTAFASLILALGSLTFAFLHHNHRSNHQPAIIMATNSYVKSAPASGASDLFILHAGTKVEITDELADWKKIELTDGKIGWIPNSAVEEI